MTVTTGEIELAGVYKHFGNVAAVDGVNLKIPDGAYCCFLGPSGCGKTTILRMIAGHEDPTGGEILIGGEDVVGLPPVERAPEFADDAATVTALRRDKWAEHLGFARADAAALGRLVIDPCPAQDFNGADFLYFSSFQAFVDRAEWAFFRPDPRATTRRRDIVYHGNIEPGERVAIVLRAVRRGEGILAHWCHIERENDAAPLADVFTLRHDRPTPRPRRDDVP